MTLCLFVSETTVTFDKRRVSKCRGLEIYGVALTKTSISHNEQRDPLLEIREFVFYDERSLSKNCTLRRSLIIALDIVIQNYHGTTRELKICEITNTNSKREMTKDVSEILSNKPFVTISFVQQNLIEIMGKYDVIVIEDSIDDSLLEHLIEDGFIIHKGPLEQYIEMAIEIIFRSSDLTLLRKIIEPPKDQLVFVEVENNNFEWLEILKDHIKKENSKIVYLVNQNDNLSGVMGLINCLNREPFSCKFKCVFTEQRISIHDDSFKRQINKNLAYNIFKDGKWGTYVYLPFEPVDKRGVTDAVVDISTIGNLSSLKWFQSLPIYHR